MITCLVWSLIATLLESVCSFVNTRRSCGFLKAKGFIIFLRVCSKSVIIHRKSSTWVSLHSQYWYSIWEWRFHSKTAAMGFPLRDKITGGYPIKMKFTFFVRVDFQFFHNFVPDKNGNTILIKKPLQLSWCRIENTFQTRSKSHIFSLRMELPFRFILNFSECRTTQPFKEYGLRYSTDKPPCSIIQPAFSYPAEWPYWFRIYLDWYASCWVRPGSQEVPTLLKDQYLGAFHLETRPFFGLQSLPNNWLLFCLYSWQELHAISNQSKTSLLI